MYKDIILILPFFVTFFWAVTLWFGAKNAGTPKKMLALFMTVAAFLYAAHAVFFSKNYALYAVMDPIYTFANLSVFPLFYLYIKSLTKEKAFSYKSIWILSPAIFFSLISATIFMIAPKEELQNFIHVYIYKEASTFNFSAFFKLQIVLSYLERISFALLLFPSTYLSWKFIMEYEKKIKEFYSATENRSLAWTGNILTATVVSAVFSFILNSLGKSFFVDELTLIFITSILFSVLLYSIGFLGANQAFSIKDYQKDLRADKSTRHISNSDSLKSKLYLEITQVLEEKQIFRNPDLRITDISRILKTNRTYVSSVINSEFKSSFCDLINHYRIGYSKRLLLHQNVYILEYISSESGFASVNSFLRAFKKETGITPGQFRKQLQKI